VVGLVSKDLVVVMAMLNNALAVFSFIYSVPRLPCQSFVTRLLGHTPFPGWESLSEMQAIGLTPMCPLSGGANWGHMGALGLTPQAHLH